MNVNPLFPNADEHSDHESYLLHKPEKRVEPLTHTPSSGINEALNYIREKIDRIYADEPDVEQEAQETQNVQPRSKHQQFMHELSTSGKSLAEIHTDWHNYYVNLPDEEKIQVWQEFYATTGSSQFKPSTPTTSQPVSNKPVPSLPLHRRHTAMVHPAAPVTPKPAQPLPTHTEPKVVTSHPEPEPPEDNRSLSQIRHTIRDKVTAGGKLTVRHHLQSLAFGLGVGLITLVIFLFSFFNEVIIAPFIQPGRAEGATPIIIGTEAVAVTANPEIIIPKINLEIPVDFSQTSTNESVIENALENGIVHYPTTVLPGQNGNTAYFGHSSNNIFNPGKYKFAFVLLHELVPGDTFYITYSGKTYVYKVFSKTIVPPTDVGVLNNVPGHIATATLITCDPPGTSINRLVVVGDQISPDPSGNSNGNNTSVQTVTSQQQLPGNGPSLLSRIWNAIF